MENKLFRHLKDLQIVYKESFILLEWNEQNQAWHFNSGRVPQNTFGWASVAILKETEASRFCDMMDYVRGYRRERRNQAITFTTEEIKTVLGMYSEKVTYLEFTS